MKFYTGLFILALILALTLAVGSCAYQFLQFLQVDRCLDRGGVWNDDKSKCEGARSEG
jgi:hypothetical protein